MSAPLDDVDPFMPVEQTSRPHQPWGRFTITALEADLAYFNARMELIGAPRTTNQKAQLSTFKFLVEAFDKILLRLRRKTRGIG